MSSQQKLSMIALFLVCVGAMIMPFADHGPVKVVFMVLILSSCTLTLIGVTRAQRDWEDVEEALALQELWPKQREKYR
jgi:hypothetical protein